MRILMSGIVLLAIVYFTGVTNTQNNPLRTALAWIGGIALIPATIMLADVYDWESYSHSLSLKLHVVGWLVAILVLLALAFLLCGKKSWVHCVAVTLSLAMSSVSSTTSDTNWISYGW